MRLVTVLMLTLLALRAAAACDLCQGSGPGFRPLQTEVETSATVAIADLVRRGDDGRPRFRVTDVVKGGATLAAGDEVAVDTLIVPPWRTYLLLGAGDLSSDARGIGISPTTATFVRAVAAGLPPTTRPAARLRFLLPYLASPDPRVSASARQPFATAPYPTVKALGATLDGAQLVAWLAARGTALRSRGPLLLMLGATGDRRQLPRLAAWLADPRWQQRPGYDAAVAAYLTLRGPDGLAVVESALVKAPARTCETPVAAVLRGLQFHARNTKVLTAAQRLTAVRRLLRFPTAGEAVVHELRRLKDWDSLARVATFYRTHRAAHDWLAQPVRAYLEACPGPDAKRQLAALFGSD